MSNVECHSAKFGNSNSIKGAPAIARAPRNLSEMGTLTGSAELDLRRR